MREPLQQAISRVRELPAYATYKERLTNTWGLVVECDAPRQTSGTDFIQTIRVVDESLPDGVALCIFSRDANSMPRAQLGDVLELRNVIVQFWQDRPQLFAKMSKPHCFGFVLYRPGSSSSSSVAAAPPVQVFNTAADSTQAAERLPQLQALRLQALGHATAADSLCVYLRRIRDLAPPEEQGSRPACVDMRVRVLAIDERRASEEVLLYVWDATDARPVSASLQMLPSEWKGSELRLARPRRHVMPLCSDPPGLRVLQELPGIGTALPVVMAAAAVPSTGLPQVGDWIKIKVVGVAAVQGQWQAVFGKSSRLTQSQPGPAFESWHNTRLANAETCEWPQDLSKVVTACSLRPPPPRCTIRQVLLAAAGGGRAPSGCSCALMGHLPRDLREWCKLRPVPEGAAGGPEEGQPTWEWAAHLWLEDATGEVRALLLGQEGTRLLGITPQCLNSPAVLQQLQERVQQLASVDEEGGVWMDVALSALFPAQQDAQPLLLPPQQQRVQDEQQPQGQERPTSLPPSPQQQQQQQQEQEQQQPQGSPQPAGDAQQPDAQGGAGQPVEQQLQLVAVMAQQAGSGVQQPGQQQQQLLQHGALHPGAPPVGQQPVFVLHDAVFVWDQEHLQELEAAAGQQQEGFEQHSQQQDHMEQQDPLQLSQQQQQEEEEQEGELKQQRMADAEQQECLLQQQQQEQQEPSEGTPSAGAGGVGPGAAAGRKRWRSLSPQAG